MEKIIIYGGAFDPIHNGHLRSASSASMFLNADVVFVPSKGNVGKNVHASNSDRLAMCKKALKESGNASFVLDDCDLSRPGSVTYSIDTARYFQKKYKKREIYFLIGADQVNNLESWKDIDELAKIVKFAFLPRPNIKVDERIIEKYQLTLIPNYHTGDVSSEAIRNLSSLDLPYSVIEYIASNRLYYVKRLGEFLKEKRLSHSLRVASLAYMIAASNGLPTLEKAYIAGILHDIGKDIDEGKALEIMKEHYPEDMDLPEYAYHQFVGEYLAKKEFGIKDQEILKAIRYHCTGAPMMGQISRIIYAADKIEPGRGYDSRKMIKACLKDYQAGFRYVLSENKIFLEGKDFEVHNRLTDQCFEYYLYK